jgi:N-acetylglucosaminyl-diphospho-decaprenol L-rhamnosyltransferase
MTATGQGHVTVVTVAYNSAATIGPFLDSIATASSQRVRVIVSDNASHDIDQLRQVVAERGAELVANDENLGYGSGIDRAIDVSAITSEYILISNPDVILGGGSIDALVAAANSHADGGTFGPRILTPQGMIYPSARSFPSIRDGAGHALLGRVWRGNPWSARYHSKAWLADETTACGWLSGACILARSSAYEAVSGFDPRYFMYFEDVDLGRRLNQLGWTNYFVPSATVEHTGAASTSKNFKRMTRVHHDSAYTYLAAKYHGPLLAPVRWALWSSLRVRAWWLTRS